MKRKFFTGFLFFTVFYIFLTAVSLACGLWGKKYNIKNENVYQNEPKEIKSRDKEKTVKVLLGDKIVKMDMKTYLYGVVAAEMPASFEKEALKAQAVAARTETVKKMSQKNDKHPDADICNNINHCQAYYSDEDLKEKYNDEWIKSFYPKIKASVDETDGETAQYNGEPISAVFHSTSSGMTENSKDVWGGDMPYLVSVKSDGEEESPRFTEEKSFTPHEFQKLICSLKNIEFSSNPSQWFSDIVRNDSGSVKTMKICNKELKGTEIREALGLRSTNFEISAGENIRVVTKGNGHGVGLSQYGANYMAKHGYTYQDILKKYYTGISINRQ